jgi:membrane-associated phospholipid phosphatase
MSATLIPRRRAQMNRALKQSFFLFIGFIITSQQVLTKGYLYEVDHHVVNMKHYRITGLASHLLLAMDDLGLRWFTATVLLISAAVIGWRFKSFRPFNLSLLALLSLNLIVGCSKLIFGRSKPRLHFDELHVGGLSYPSGHAANALISWGLLAYIIYRYTKRAPFNGVNFTWVVVLFTTAVCTASLIRNTHWLSDLIGGLFLGGSILVAIIAVDRYFPSKKQPS